MGYCVTKTGAYVARMTGFVEGEEAVNLAGICPYAGIGAGAVAGPVMFQVSILFLYHFGQQTLYLCDRFQMGYDKGVQDGNDKETCPMQ